MSGSRIHPQPPTSQAVLPPIAENDTGDISGDVDVVEEDPELDPSSKQELRGWIAFDFANSVYASVAIGILLPLLLVELAESRAGGPPPGVVELAGNPDADRSDPTVGFMGARVSPTSVTLYFVSISVIVQALVFITVGAAADHGSLRKRMLLVTAFAGAFFTALVLPMGGEDSLWWVVGILTVLSNVCYGCSIVFYNAYLPLLVAAHPDVLAMRAEGVAPHDVSVKEEMIANEISTHGFAAGYASGLGLLIVVIGMVLAMGTESTLSVRLGIFLSGLWWAVFTLYTAKHLKTRPGPPLPAGASYATYGWSRFFQTVRHARRLPDTFAFLISYFLTSDAVSTVSTVGILFAREVLGLGTSALLVVALIVPVCALIGNYAYLHAQRRLGWPSKKMYIFVLFMIALIPTYAFCGFFAPFGLVQPFEIYIFAVWFGFHVGIVQSLSRVIYSELIPPSMESSFFSLYEITDRGSSWIGPLGVAALRDATGEIRWGLFYLFFMITVPIPVIMWVDVERGKARARAIDDGVTPVGDTTEPTESTAMTAAAGEGKN